MIVSAEAFLRKFSGLFSRSEWVIRLLKLSRTDGAAQPGLVMIQIDGLGFSQLEHALKKGNLPFLARLLKKEGYLKERLYSGIPSNTPAVQGMLFYGVKTCTPAFSYRDRQTGLVFNLFHNDSASVVEKRIHETCKPSDRLLAGGSSYGNIFTGGADESHFCVASMGWGGFLKGASPFGIPLTAMLNAHIFIRALILILIEFALSLFDCFRWTLTGRKFLAEIIFIPLRVSICVLLREIIAAGVKIDIARGLRVIHANLAGYDEQSHHRGPTSAFAHWSLRGIDSAIATIWRAAHRSRQREYDVFIYADHGQEDTRGYGDVHGRPIGEAVNQVFKEKILSGGWRTEVSYSIPYWRAHLLHEKSKEAQKASGPPTPEKLTAVTAMMGPVGHIYLPQALSQEEKEKFAEALVVEAKIPMVMIAGDKGVAHVSTENGRRTLPADLEKIIDKNHPFFGEIGQDLADLCHHPDAGDFVILGWKRGSPSITYPDALGGHAGPGPEETSGFALLPADAFPRGLEIFRPEDLRAAALRSLDRGSSRAFFGMGERERISSTVRILTYNVHGCGGRDGKVSPNRIARIIAQHHPDIVALQELDVRKESHQAEIIGQKLAMSFEYHSFQMKKGQHGNALFSRFPMRPIRSGSLPRLLSRSQMLEPRGALWVEMDIEGNKVHVINTHLSISYAEGLLQVEALMGPDWIGNPACKGPLVVCGDFNAFPKSKICNRICQTLRNAQYDLLNHRPLKTLPSFHPLGLVDHIFVGEGIRTVSIEVPRTGLEKIASDHLPLVVDLELVPQ